MSKSLIKGLSLALLFGVVVLAMPVECADGRFNVSVTVLPVSGRGAAALDAIALPDGAIAMAAGRDSRSSVVEHEPAEAAEHFRQTLSASGWRLVDEKTANSGSVEQTWEGSHGRLLVRMQAPLGGYRATRVVLSSLGA